jgi:hypothetical protein
MTTIDAPPLGPIHHIAVRADDLDRAVEFYRVNDLLQGPDRQPAGPGGSSSSSNQVLRSSSALAGTPAASAHRAGPP